MNSAAAGGQGFGLRRKHTGSILTEDAREALKGLESLNLGPEIIQHFLFSCIWLEVHTMETLKGWPRSRCLD